ncbi:MAG TPA: 30S ribosomal protein S8 [bacterium]|nr:30S ribosomal protein S8 [Myxococcales bacterium]OQA58620.1 MAG: 30S ribosomal protein S8 [bacterium ADurb.Bin270]HPW45366.1 30S ribosomal protein S8 [bacterium]HQH80756.1 30S ribosomal protein S8 [bacterium]
MFNDSIADLLTRVRNAANAGHEKVVVPYSKAKESIARIIVSEGFLSGVEVVGTGKEKALAIDLKYRDDGSPTFSSLQRVSKLGRRVYLKNKEIGASRQGMGVSIISTSKGIMKDVDAKRMGLGGEVICSVW